MVASSTIHAARRGDNFLPLRHLAALMVIYGHSYALTQHASGEADFIAKSMPGFYAGNLAVYLFFAISGYLVTLSLMQRPGLWRYVRNRALRVFPAYLVCLMVCVLVVGIAFTTLPTAEYLGNTLTWRFFADNVIPISLQWTLPGVFATNPYPHVVNGTLWSLGLEIRWYIYLGILTALTVIHRRRVFTLSAIAWIAYCSWQWWHGVADPNDHRALGLTFLIGALCAQWRDRIPASHALMVAFVVACVLAHGSRWFGPAMVLTAVYFAYWAAYAVPALHWPRQLDYSLWPVPVRISGATVDRRPLPGDRTAADVARIRGDRIAAGSAVMAPDRKTGIAVQERYLRDGAFAGGLNQCWLLAGCVTFAVRVFYQTRSSGT